MMRKTLTTTALGTVVALVAGCATAAGPFERGMAHYNNGQYFFAAHEFSEAVRQNPNSAAAYVNRGVARVRLGELNAAIDDYNRAIALKPDDPAIYFNRGNALVAAGQYALAIEDFTRAVGLSPVFAKAWFNRGTAHSMLGQSEAAMRDWLQAIELETDPWARAAMRRTAGLDPLPPPATVAATPPVAPAASPPSPQSIDARALATRAISRELDGDHEGALQDLRAALAIEQDQARRASIETLLRLLETPR
jgi:tetratricopeptide (TPR) repeat protein